jgi:hypothetical protein
MVYASSAAHPTSKSGDRTRVSDGRGDVHHGLFGAADRFTKHVLLRSITVPIAVSLHQSPMLRQTVWEQFDQAAPLQSAESQMHIRNIWVTDRVRDIGCLQSLAMAQPRDGDDCLLPRPIHQRLGRRRSRERRGLTLLRRLR